MKMIQGTGPISNYGNYINNCQRHQWPYKIPVESLNDIQLYIDIGGLAPDVILYELIHTCGPFANTTEVLTTSNYIIGQNCIPINLPLLKQKK